MSSPACNCTANHCKGRNTEKKLQHRAFEGKRMQKMLLHPQRPGKRIQKKMIHEKYNMLRAPARISPHMASKQEKKWIADGYIDNVTTLQEQEGFSLQMVEYHYGNMSNPYLMHDCDPPEEDIEKAWYGTADHTDNNHCIYCSKPYPTEILTAARLLNASLAYKFET